MHFTSAAGFAALVLLLSARASPISTDSSSRGAEPASAIVTPLAARYPSPRGPAPDPQTSMPAWRIRATPESANNNPDWRRGLD